jgi:hypothetical protein
MVGAVATGLLASGCIMLASSYSIFASTATNPGNVWSAGSVVINDDDSGSALFSLAPGAGQINSANMKPGASVVNCVRVTYTGALQANVRIFVSSVSGVNGGGGTGILPYLHVKIEESSAGGAFGSCGAFGAGTTIWDTSTHGGVASDLINVFPTTYATGPSTALATWSNNTWRAYRFTFTLDSSTPDTSQGATATAAFNWQAQNT